MCRGPIGGCWGLAGMQGVAINCRQQRRRRGGRQMHERRMGRHKKCCAALHGSRSPSLQPFETAQQPCRTARSAQPFQHAAMLALAFQPKLAPQRPSRRARWVSQPAQYRLWPTPTLPSALQCTPSLPPNPTPSPRPTNAACPSAPACPPAPRATRRCGRARFRGRRRTERWPTPPSCQPTASPTTARTSRACRSLRER